MGSWTLCPPPVTRTGNASGADGAQPPHAIFIFLQSFESVASHSSQLVSDPDASSLFPPRASSPRPSPLCSAPSWGAYGGGLAQTSPDSGLSAAPLASSANPPQKDLARFCPSAGRPGSGTARRPTPGRSGHQLTDTNVVDGKWHLLVSRTALYSSGFQHHFRLLTS
ncbi:uncharacterized protein WM294_001783 [Sarcoramphus papa]